MITTDKIGLTDSFIHVDGIGRIGMYSHFDKAIILDYSLKFMNLPNQRIPCEYHEIKQKICDLFNKKVEYRIDSKPDVIE